MCLAGPWTSESVSIVAKPLTWFVSESAQNLPKALAVTYIKCNPFASTVR